MLDLGQEETLKDLGNIVKVGDRSIVLRRVWIRTWLCEKWCDRGRFDKKLSYCWETAAVLKIWGKVPSEKERLASMAIKSAKTVWQDLIKAVGIKSIEELFGGMVERSLKTSADVTGLSVSKGRPV